MNAIARYCPNITLFHFSDHAQSAIQRTALKAIAETTVMLGLYTFCIPFVVPASAALFTYGMASQLGVQLVFRIAYEYQKYLGPSANQKFKEFLISGYSLNAAMAMYNGQVLVHELGHAAAAQALFSGANPKIRLIPYGGSGRTSFKAPISNRGAFLLKVTAAGPIAGVAIATILLIAALFLKNVSKPASASCFWASFTGFWAHFSYALDALSSPPSSSHDFQALAKAGYHPIVCATIILAIPLIIFAGVYFLQTRDRN